MKLRIILIALLVPCMLLMSLVFVGRSPVHARSASASCVSGPFNCVATQAWPGNTLAGLTTVYVPNFTGSSLNGIFRYIGLGGTLGGDVIIVGYCFGTNITVGDISCAANGGMYFYDDTTTRLLSSEPIASGDKGHTVEIGASSDGRGGANFWIHNTNSGDDLCTPCNLSPVNSNWNRIALVDIVVATWSGTHQGPFTWTNNQWGNSSGFQDQSNKGNGISASNPPQAQWTSSPAGESNEGGTLTMCEKDSGMTC